MAKMKAFPLGRRIMALFLTALMCVSLVQISAFAAENQTSAQQITADGGTNYYKADGTKGTGSDYDAAVSKTISGTDTENVFDVNVKVETKKKVTTKTTQTPAHVVLVIDASGSMGGSTNSLMQARKAAKEFANTFLGTDSADENMLAMVAFSHGVDKYTHLYGKSGLNNIKNAIDSDEYSAGGGTNTQAGIHAAQDILSQGHTDGVKDIILLMSDGVPTYSYRLTGTATWEGCWEGLEHHKGINGHIDTDTIQVTGTSTKVIGSGSSYYLTGNLSVAATCKHGHTYDETVTYGDLDEWGYSNNGYAAKWEAAQAKAAGTEIYSVLLTGNGMDSDDQAIAQDVMSSIASKNDADHVITTGNASGLAAAFQKISSSVTEGGDANGTTVTDPMGTYIKLDTDFSKDAYVKNDDGTLTWTLDNKDVGRYSESGSENDKTYTYTLTYQVKLDNTASGFSSNTPYSLGAAALSYTNAGDSKSHTAVSPQPAVEGYLGGFTFQKRASGDETGAVIFGSASAAKANAEFTVTSANGKIVKTAWTQNNLVTFLNTLPSGQTYTLKETRIANPKGGDQDLFIKSEKTYTVTVSYGHTVVKDGDKTVYDSSVTSNDMVFVNDYDPHMVSLTITKDWMDSQNTANRPDSIDVKLMQINGVRDGSENAPADDPADTLYQTISMTGSADASSWTENVANVPTINSETGNPISYYISEVKAEGYTAAVTSDFTLNAEKTAAAATITNTRSKNTDITVSKHWVTVNGYETLIGVGLQRNDQKEAYVSFELGKGQDQQHKFEKLPLYRASSAYSYVPVEIVAKTLYGAGSTVTLDGYMYSVSVDGNTITNTLVQDNNTTLTGSKAWNVADYAGDKTALTAAFTATGTADGTEVKTASTTISYGNGTYTISGLPTYAYKVNGTWTTTADADATQVEKIQYTVAETTTGADGIYSIKTGNNFENRLKGTTSVTATKVWVDSGNIYNTRPDSITFDLYRNGKQTDLNEVISAAVQEAPKTENAGAASSEAGSSAPAEAAPSKTWDGVDLSVKFDSLDKYDAQGKLITYTVVERGTDSNNNLILDGKDTNYDVTTSANQNTDGTFAYTITNTLNGDKTSYTVQKVWSDTLASHSAEATITLIGKTDGYNKTYTEVLKGDASYTFENLPKYANGNEIAYTASEAPVDGYTSHQRDFIFTNVINQDETVSVSGEKAWVNKDAVQPDKTTVFLQSDVSGEMKNVTDKSAVLSGKTQSYRFESLPKYAYQIGSSWTARQPDTTDNVTAVREIVYQVTDSVNGYTTTGGTKADGYNLTNTFKQQYTSIDGSKVWHAGSTDLSKAEITVGLYQDDKLIDTTTASAATEWKYSFGKNADGTDTLPLYNGYDQENTPIAKTYYVREMNGDKPIENGGTFGDYKVTYSSNTIINSLSKIDTATTTVTAAKLWKGPQADSTTVTLTRSSNGNQDSSFSKELTLSKSDSWNTSVKDLPALDQDGYDYTYSIVENGAQKEDGGKEVITLGDKTYDVIYSEDHLTVTNIIHQETIDKSGEKTWEETKNVPNSIQVQLYADGVSLGESFVQTVNVNKDGKWIYTFKDLPKYNLSDTNQDGVIDTDGSEIRYTVREIGEKADSYMSGNQHFNVTYNGMDIENTLVSTDTYAYRVNRVYNIYLDGNLQTPVTKDGDPIALESASPVSVDTSSYPTEDKMTGYTLVSASVKKEGAADAAVQTVGRDGKFNFNVTDPNVTYVVTLTYEIRQTTPYIPPNPGPNPPVVIPNQPTEPPVKIPDTNPPTTDIPDGNTPTAEKPTPATPGKPTSEIPEGRTPLASAPRTGDALAAWLTAAIVSGAGLAWLAISAKKRREENAQ